MNRKESNVQALAILRCQQCLGELSFAKTKLVCNHCKITYPISKGLIFMGYDRRREGETQRIIATERNHQVDIGGINKWYDFAYPSFRIGLLSIGILRHDIKTKNPDVIDIGSGGSPMGMMLSRYGFNVFRCDLEPNSLFSGFFWEYRKHNMCKYIACDASILPFADASVDVIYCKEFVHHVKDHNHLFGEINRVLKKNGIFLMIEPTLAWSRFLSGNQHVHFGHHYQTAFNYYYTLQRNGFLPYRYYIYFYDKSRRMKSLNKLKHYFDMQICSRMTTPRSEFLLKMYVQQMIGGTIVLFSKKIIDTSLSQKRPVIEVISPELLTLSKNNLGDIRLQKFNKILGDVHNDISQILSNIEK